MMMVLMITAEGNNMITGYYKIADRIIRITSFYEDVHTLCSGYRVDGEPSCDIEVDITRSDIEYEIGRSDNGDKYQEGYLEELAVYRKIATEMLKYDTFLMHGSVVSVDGQAYMFTARSGTGKSTHVKLWCDLLGDQAVMVNDDKPLINVSGSRAIVYGTPYNGKHRRGSNMSAPLKAICYLTRSETNSIEEVSSRDLYHILLQQIYRPAQKDQLVRTISLIDKLTKDVKFYILKCNMDIEAAKTSYNAMKG